jgi:hypothetical protein
MTDLRQSLLKADFSHLKAVAAKWNLPFTAPDARVGLKQLVSGILNPGFISLIPDILTEEEREALLWLDARGGKELRDRYSREFGEIREMGAGKLEREKPYQETISLSESLWYRALISSGFLETDDGLREFVFIPEDIRSLLIPLLKDQQELDLTASFTCRQASLREYKIQTPASGEILDHFCTLLAGLRMSIDPVIQLPGISANQLGFYHDLARSADLLEKNDFVQPDRVRDFFELSREEAIKKLWHDWLFSEELHDINQLPGISVEGNPEMNPVRIRELVLRYVNNLDPDQWWSIESFVSRIKEVNPDLMRKSGEYDTWFIRNTESDDFIKGFDSWDEVEGSLVKYLLTGPLHWLGYLDLGFADEDELSMAFRLSKISTALNQDDTVPLKTRKTESIQIRSKGEIRMTQNVPHKTRYQVARFCEWYPIRAEAYLYAITPKSLRRAENQGLRITHLLTLLQNNLEIIPPNILAALERWEKKGVQATIAKKTVLRLGSPQILKALKKSSASRFILEQVGPTTVIVKDGSEEKIKEALVELGFFLERDDQEGSQT